MRKNAVTGAGTLLYILFLFLVSCNSISTISIQALEPAKHPAPPGLVDFALINRASAGYGDSIDPALYELIAYETLLSLVHILDESPGASARKEVPATSGSGTQPADPIHVMQICNYLKTDGLISLDLFLAQFSDTLLYHNGVKETGWHNYFENRMELYLTVKWSAYNGTDGSLFDEYIMSDTIAWSHSAWNIQDTWSGIPSEDEMLKEAAYIAALDYARRLSPYWIEDTRLFYAGGNSALRRAGRHISYGMFSSAEDKLAPLLQHPIRKISGAALFNMALIYEIRGDYLQALKYARRSHQELSNSFTAAYVSLLEERVEKAVKLDRQLGREAD